MRFWKKTLVKLFTMRQLFPRFQMFCRVAGDGCPQTPRQKAIFMGFVKVILMLLVLAFAPVGGRAYAGEGQATTAQTNIAAATGTAEDHSAKGEHAGKEEHGLSAGAVDIGHIGPLPITNSMLVCWIVAVGLIIFAQVATRNIKAVPTGVQNFWELIVESLYGFLEGILGPDLVKRSFWFFASIFIFILACNWFGLIPGIGTIGAGYQTEHGFHVTEPFFRGVNADVNMTLAMSIIFFVLWFVWSLQANGLIGFLKHLFAPKGESTGALKALLVVVFFAVGFLEIISILVRPVSLTFRLYGNIFAGETMLETMSTMVPSLGWLLPIPFYFMELLVGLVQALVFMLLTAVFTMLMTQHDDEGHGHAKAHH